jgi:hypothetical protein
MAAHVVRDPAEDDPETAGWTFENAFFQTAPNGRVLGAFKAARLGTFERAGRRFQNG